MKKITMTGIILCHSLWAMGCPPSLSPKQQRATRQLFMKTKKPKNEWRAATFRGLTVGKSTSADMLKAFGKPGWSDAPSGQRLNDPQSEVWNDYEGIGEFPGKLTVTVDKRSSVILRMDLYPENLRKEEAIKYFGDDYILTKYDIDEYSGNEESATLYESPNGEIEFIEYRSRGLAIKVNYEGKVDEISYVNKPLGAPSPKCK